jgi:hypothetical protein
LRSLLTVTLAGIVPLNPLREQFGMAGLLQRLPIVALTTAGKDVDLDAEPDEGKPADAVAALDAAADAETIAVEAEREALRLAEEAEQKLRQFESAKTASKAGEAEAVLRNVESIANRAAQESAQARAQAEQLHLSSPSLESNLRQSSKHCRPTTKKYEIGLLTRKC